MIYIASRTGVNHEVCEDAVLVGTEILSGSSGTLAVPEEGFVCVADGVGGNNGGAQASRFVLTALAEFQTSKGSLRDALVHINSNLIEDAKSMHEAANMATTLTGFCRFATKCQLIHIGNTRAYIRQGQYLKQITSDHTTYNWLKSCGQQEAAEACNKNEITNCFGGANEALLSKLVVTDLPLFALMVITSDGVHEYVDLDTLENILNSESSYNDKCEAILNEAAKNGSKDDMTIVVVVPEE